MGTRRRSRATQKAAEARRRRRDALRAECAWLFSYDPPDGATLTSAGGASASHGLGDVAGKTMRRAYDTIVAGCQREPGLYLVTGPRGVGKSFFLRRLPSELGAAGHLVIPSRASFDLDQFLGNLSAGLDIARPLNDFGAWLERLRIRLAEKRAAPVLVLDDADLVSDAVFHAFPPLFALDLDASAALRVVLAGRPDLERRIKERRDLREYVRQSVGLESLDAEGVASLLAEDGLCPSLDSDSIAALIWHARGLPADLFFLVHQARLSADEAGRTIPALEDVERAANRLRPSTAPTSAPAREELPSHLPDLHAYAAAWLARVREPNWHAWRKQLIAHARAVAHVLREGRALPQVVAVKHSLRRIAAGLERRAVALADFYQQSRTRPVRVRLVAAIHARRRDRFFIPAMYGGVAAAAALFVMVQLGNHTPAPLAPTALSASSKLASASAPPEAPTVVLPIAPSAATLADGRSQPFAPPLDLSSRIVMAEPQPVEPPMDEPAISPAPAPTVVALAPNTQGSQSLAAAAPAVPPQPSVPDANIQAPPMPSVRVAALSSPRAKEARAAPPPARDKVALDVPQVGRGAPPVAQPAAAAPVLMTASLVTGGEPQCQPYRSNADYAGHPVQVSGLACRDSAGQWWLMNQAN